MGEVPEQPQPQAENTDVPVERRRFGIPALIAALVLVGALFVFTLAPVAAPLLLGTLLAAFAAPLYRRVLGTTNRPTLSAALVTSFLFIAVLVPLSFVVFAVVRQLQSLL